MVTIIVMMLATGLAALVVWAWTPDIARKRLEARYLERPGDMMVVSGIRLHVRDRGPRSAPVVIMLHGTASHLQTWDGWTRLLKDKFRVISLDLPGNGLSGLDPDNNYTDARTLELFQALLNRLDIARASLIGNSLGGRIAWQFAAAHPDRTVKLVLVSPDGFASPGFEYGKAPDVPAMLDLMQYALPKVLLRPNLAAAYADPARLSKATLNRYHDLMRPPGVRAAILARMRQTMPQPAEPMLRKITAPTLLLWGKEDRMIPTSNAADYLRVMPDARLVQLEDTCHVPQEEAPAKSVMPVLEFLQQP